MERSALSTTPLTTIPTVRAADVVSVAAHDVVDLLLGSEPAPGNPFDAEIRVTLRGPDAALITVPAFWDPPRGYVARVTFPSTGSWHASITADGGLGLELSLPVHVTPTTRAAEHGPLVVDRNYPRHLVHADGTHRFIRGYEVNWLLMVDQHDPSLTRVRGFLDTIEAAGFTMVTVNAYAHSFRKHVPAELESDPRWIVPTIGPWLGGNADPDHSRLDPAFFAHMDDALALLHERGIVTHLMLHVYNKDVNWPELGSADDDRYWRYIVARYQAFSTIMWDTGKESYHQPADYVWTRLALIREHDGYGRLLTAHDVNPPAGHDWGEFGRRYTHPDKELLNALVDVVSDQVLIGIYDDALARTTRFAKPYINIEFGYESGLDDLPSDAEDHDQDWQEVTRRHWQVVMGGAYPNYYYRNTAWSLFLPEPTPPGYAAIKVLAEFWDGLRYWLLSPANHLLSHQGESTWARADGGDQFVVYAQEGGEFALDLSGATAAVAGHWLDPYTGATVPVPPLSRGRHRLASPWGTSAAVLLLHT